MRPQPSPIDTHPSPTDTQPSPIDTQPTPIDTQPPIDNWISNYNAYINKRYQPAQILFQ